MPTAMAAAANGTIKLLAPVDAFAPNPFGLYGMLGNAWQWTADCWHQAMWTRPPTAAPGADRCCAQHVIRGGAWNNVPIFMRSAQRAVGAPKTAPTDYDYSSLTGFRVARELP